MNEHLELPAQYKIGHEQIDTQHSQLFVVLMRVVKVMKNEEHRNEREVETEINELFTSLRSYTQGHFLYEERHMEKIKYPELESHKELHRFFIGKIIEIQKDALKQKNGKVFLLKEMAVFIKDWYMGHILVEDKKYIAYQNEQKNKTENSLSKKT